jgi:hypothetical protein
MTKQVHTTMSKGEGQQRNGTKQAKSTRNRMSRIRAAEILGVERDAQPDDVRKAYRISLVRMRASTNNNP